MNQWNGIGRITKDLELKKTQAGTSVISFNLAVDRQFKKDDGPTADFISIQCWNKTADNLYKFCKKGSQIGVTGHIQTRNYDDASGKKVYVTEVIADSVQFLDSKSSSQTGESNYASKYSNDVETSSTDGGMLEISSEDLPF